MHYILLPGAYLKKSRLRLANALIILKICYGIQVWGTCKVTWIKMVQIVQNKAVRYVTKLLKHTKVNVCIGIS